MNKNSKKYKAAYMKKWRVKNKDYVRNYIKHKRATNSEFLNNCRLWNKKYYNTHKKRINKKNMTYLKKLYKTDPVYRLSTICISRIYQALKMQKVPRYYPYKTLIGCSWEDLKKYIEGKFKPGMSWKYNNNKYNRTGNEFHIDHIKPIASFDLSYGRNQLKAFNYKNLQPLFIKDHAVKTVAFEYKACVNLRKAQRNIREYKKALKMMNTTV